MAAVTAEDRNGEGGDSYEVQEEQHRRRKHGGMGGGGRGRGDLGRLCRPAPCLSLTCHPQGGALEQPACSGAFNAMSPPRPTPPSTPKQPLAMPHNLQGEAQASPQGAKPCKKGRAARESPGALTSLPRKLRGSLHSPSGWSSAVHK